MKPTLQPLSSTLINFRVNPTPVSVTHSISIIDNNRTVALYNIPPGILLHKGSWCLRWQRRDDILERSLEVAKELGHDLIRDICAQYSAYPYTDAQMVSLSTACFNLKPEDDKPVISTSDCAIRMIYMMMICCGLSDDAGDTFFFTTTSKFNHSCNLTAPIL